MRLLCLADFFYRPGRNVCYNLDAILKNAESMTRLLIQLILILCLCENASVSQVAEVEEPVACNEEFAKFLVDQQVAESKSVEETDRRIRILIRAADFLWRNDQLTAREYLTEAFKVAGDRFSEKGFERRENKGLTTILPDYRFEVIKAIAAKDSDWAKRLIDQLLKEYEKAAADRSANDKVRELDDVLRIAVDSVKTNPELSRHLFRRAMAHPLDFHWFWTLFTVAGTNAAMADELYAELLVNYADATPRRLLFLSAYPFASARMFGVDRFGFGATRPETLVPNRNLQLRFIDVFLRRAVSYASDPRNLEAMPDPGRSHEAVYIMTSLAELEPIIVRDFPSLIQRLSEARGAANGMLSEQMRKDAADKEQRNEALGHGFERRLKELEKADSEGKLTDYMIVSLVTWTEIGKTEEQFKQLEPWLDKIVDPAVRAETVNYFWFLRATLAVKEGRLDDAEKFAKKVPEVEHRAVLFFNIAEQQLKNPNDAATVYQTLREVGRLAERADDSVEKARVLLGLVNQYLKVNPQFAMQELSDAVKVVNRLERPNLLATGVTRQISGKNFSFFAIFSMPGSDLENTFREIGKNNFEMSLSNAKSLEDKYLRTIAVLAVAKNCVDVKKKKLAPKASTPGAGGF